MTENKGTKLKEEEKSPIIVWVFADEYGSVTTFHKLKEAELFMKEHQVHPIKFNGKVAGAREYINGNEEGVYITRCEVK